MLFKITFIALIGLVASQEIRDLRCPYGAPRPPIHLPHEDDCNKYYKCHYCNKHILMCQPDQEFDMLKQECVKKGEADCDGTSVPILTTLPPSDLCDDEPTSPSTIPPTVQPEITTLPVTEPELTTPTPEPTTSEPETTILSTSEPETTVPLTTDPAMTIPTAPCKF